MTTIMDATVEGAVCGTVSSHMVVWSTNTFGWADLDMRPPEMQRSTIPYWVQQCPSCGYCAADISESPPGVAGVVATEGYRSQLEDASYPALAKSFLCSALIAEHEGDFSAAGWSALHAAWACDDAGDDAAASNCRSQAIDFFRRARAIDQPFSDGIDVEHVLLADLLEGLDVSTRRSPGATLRSRRLLTA